MTNSSLAPYYVAILRIPRVFRQSLLSLVVSCKMKGTVTKFFIVFFCGNLLAFSIIIFCCYFQAFQFRL